VYKRQLLGLVQDGLAWVKLSGPARITSHAVPPYGDVTPLVEALCAANPDRLLWGSDWPHTALSRRTPTLKELVDMAIRWLPDPELALRVLVTNPQKLYGFSKSI
jgi:predicted TIM-barrel fold metal-dependent hydrolase